MCEEFLGFVKLTSLDAETIARNILDALREWGLNLEYLVGQGYDGAAVTGDKRRASQDSGRVSKSNIYPLQVIYSLAWRFHLAAKTSK